MSLFNQRFSLLSLFILILSCYGYGQTLNLGTLSSADQFNLDLAEQALQGQNVDFSAPVLRSTTVDLSSQTNGYNRLTNASVFNLNVDGIDVKAIPTPFGVIINGPFVVMERVVENINTTLDEVEANYGSINEIGQAMLPFSYLRPQISYEVTVNRFQHPPIVNADFNSNTVSGGNAIVVPIPVFSIPQAYQNIRDNRAQAVAQYAFGLGAFATGPAGSVAAYGNFIYENFFNDGNPTSANLNNVRYNQYRITGALRYLGGSQRTFVGGSEVFPDGGGNIQPQLINRTIPTDGTSYALNKAGVKGGLFTYKSRVLRNDGTYKSYSFKSDNTDLVLSPSIDDLEFTDISVGSYVQDASAFVEYDNSASYSQGVNWNLGNLQVSDYDGVDFTNLSVAGITIDEGTKVVNFLLEGEGISGNQGANLTNVSTLQKKAFLQALAIPASKQFVDMDIRRVNGSDQGFARADPDFKKTDICVTFFRADEQMKIELNRVFSGLGTPDNIYQEWDAILRRDMQIYNQMINDDNYYPALTGVSVRGLIVPELPRGSQDDDRVFISDSKYKLDRFLENISIAHFDLNLNSTVDNSPARTRVNNYVNNRIKRLQNVLRGRLNNAADIVENKINAGTHPAFQELNVILPSLVAAEWYKQQNIPDKQFGALINSLDLTDRFTGKSIAADAPFNQSYWNSRSYQNIVSSTVNIVLNNQFTFVLDVTVRGGVNPQTSVNHLGNVSNGQSNLFNNIRKNGAARKFRTDYVNGGALDHRLPELAFNYLRVAPSSSNYGRGAYQTERPTEIVYSVINTGKVKPAQIVLQFYWRKVKDDGTYADNLLRSIGTVIRSDMRNGIYKEINGTLPFTLPAYRKNMELVAIVTHRRNGQLGQEMSMFNNITYRRYPLVHIAGGRVTEDNGGASSKSLTTVKEEEIVVSADILKRDSFVFVEEIERKEFATTVNFLSKDGNVSQETQLHTIKTDQIAKDSLLSNSPIDNPLMTRDENITFTPYPVPFIDELNLHLQDDRIPVRLEVLNSLGGQVLQKPLSDQVSKDVKVNTTTFPNGTYFFIVDFANGTREIVKVVK